MSSRSNESPAASAAQVRAYQRTRVLTAGPENLQLMLYDGAIRFCEQARLSLAAGDREGALQPLERARRIVLYLTDCLKPELAPELCALVASAYMYVYRRLVEASLHGSSEALEGALGVLGELRSAWAELLQERLRTAQEHTSPTDPGDPVAPDASESGAAGASRGIRLTG